MQIDLVDLLQIVSIVATAVWVFHLKKKVKNELDDIHSLLSDMKWDINRLIASDMSNHSENSMFSKRQSPPELSALALSKYLKDLGLDDLEDQALSPQAPQCHHNPSQTSPGSQQTPDPLQIQES